MSGFVITEITAFIAVDDGDGDEGVMAFMDTTLGTWMPMVAADPARADQLRNIARTMFAHVDWVERRFVVAP